jgi:hypothetical protein
VFCEKPLFDIVRIAVAPPPSAPSEQALSFATKKMKAKIKAHHQTVPRELHCEGSLQNLGVVLVRDRLLYV